MPASEAGASCRGGAPVSCRLLLAATLLSCAAISNAQLASLHDPREVRLRNVRQLTFGGDNAEAYWSFDGSRLVFQARRGDMPADQVFVINADGTGERQVSDGRGRRTCAYFLKGDHEIIYSSTAGYSPAAPPPADRSHGYVWPVWPYYAIYRARVDGSGARPLLPRRVKPGVPTAYYAEATVSPDGKRIIFTSTMDGDLEIYSMRADGTDVRRLTNRLGYDGGPYYSPDGKRIVWRAWYPRDAKEREDYLSLLRQNLVRPTRMEIWVAEADGTGARQVTRFGAASFAPFFAPDGRHIIFSSNMDDPKGRDFELYLIGVDGAGLERITYGQQFDSFPMFSPDGKRLVWCSNRHGRGHQTNVFVADWLP